MAIYLHHTTIVQDRLPVRWGGTGHDFVIIELDEHTSLAVHSAAEADEGIRAFAEAKRKLLGEAATSPKAEAVPAPRGKDPQALTPGATCGDRKPRSNHVATCTRAKGHAGGHAEHAPGGSVSDYWQDESAAAVTP